MNKSQIVKKVKETINRSRHTAEMTANLNLQRASADLAFKANHINLVNVRMQIAKLFAEGKAADTENALLKVLLKDREEILKRLKLSENDLTSNYSCKKCNDTGIQGEKFCVCYNTLFNNELAAVCGGAIDRTHTFKASDSSLFKNNENMRMAYEKMKEFCNKVPNTPFKIITLHGAVGIGKSYLVECMCNQLIEKDMLTQFVTAFNFNNTLLKFHTTFDDSKSTFIDSLLDPDVLVIDDLGTEPILSNVTKEYLLLIINERLQNYKFTIITTNLSFDEILERYGERVFSRLTNKNNTKKFNLLGKDLRHKKIK